MPIHVLIGFIYRRGLWDSNIGLSHILG